MPSVIAWSVSSSSEINFCLKFNLVAALWMFLLCFGILYYSEILVDHRLGVMSSLVIENELNSPLVG